MHDISFTVMSMIGMIAGFKRVNLNFIHGIEEGYHPPVVKALSDL